MAIGEEEDIARAICSEKWDPETGRLSPSLFKGANTSVSRLAITPLEQTWELFRCRVEKPPDRMLERIGTINAKRLSEIGKTYENGPITLTVEPDPKEGYESHAIIPEKISRGLANQIVNNLTLQEES